MENDRPISPWQEWRIVEKIGEGSYGRVYKAERLEQGKNFYSAIKVITIPSSRGELNNIRHETSDEESARQYFQNLVDDCILEVSTMECFRGNSHIVSVEDFKVVEYLDEIGWDIYIRMEFLQSFLEYCTGRVMTERKVIKLGIDICKALEYCGRLRIIHRDIKPENIFVSRFGDFKLGDFGIARELERSMSGMSKKGTFSYMAPEMYRGDAYDSCVDIYSLGIVLYKLMNSNRLPFMDLGKQLITYRDKEVALARRMAGEPLPPPAEASPELAEIILRACAFDVRDRYQDPELLRVDLERLRRGEYIAGKTAMNLGRSTQVPQDTGHLFPFTDAQALSGIGRVAEEIRAQQKPSKEEKKENVSVPLQTDTLRDSTVNEEELWKSLESSTDVEADFATPEQALEGWQAPSPTLPGWAIGLMVLFGVGGLLAGFFGRSLFEGSRGEERVLEERASLLPGDLQERLEEEEESLPKEAAQACQQVLSLFEEADLLLEDEEFSEGTRYLDEEGQVKAVLSQIGDEDAAYFYDQSSVLLVYISDHSSAEILYYNPGQELICWSDREGNVHDDLTGDTQGIARGEEILALALQQLE